MSEAFGKPTGVQLISNNRRIIRSAKNPLDKCTVVSIFQREIDEIKHTIEPGRFHIDKGTYENPAILVVGSSSWWKDIDFEQPMLEIPHSSIQVAESIVKDYCNGMLGCNMSDTMPGLFYVLGEQTLMDIKSKYKTKLEDAKIKQDNWFKILVRMADSLWSRSNNNPLSVSEDMRLAARSLNFHDKPWLKDFNILAMVNCKACGSMKNPDYPVCGVCKAIDPNHPQAKELKFAV